MGYLHILSEDDSDDLFYRGCVEKILGRDFQSSSFRVRTGGGLSEVRKKLPIFLRGLQHSGHVDDVYFIVAMDNDRSRVHPEHQLRLDQSKASKLPRREQDKLCRYCELHQQVCNVLGGLECSDWVIPGVIAVPVEMLESWLLLISNPDCYQSEETLPLFSKKSAMLARHYFASSQPPNQLKDLVLEERDRLGLLSNQDYCLHCVEQLDPDALAQVSPSFAHFKQQVEAWV